MRYKRKLGLFLLSLSISWFLAFSSPPPYELIENLAFTKTGADINLTWDLAIQAQPDKGIAVFHKLQGVALLDGSTTTYSMSIPTYGVHDVSVLWLWDWGIYDIKTVEVQVGFLTWDPPATGPSPEGYMVYIFETQPDPGMPPTGAVSFDAGNSTSLSLTDLFLAGIIQTNKDYWATIASYISIPGGSYKWMSTQAGPVGPFQFVDKRLVMDPIPNAVVNPEDVH